MNEPCMPLKNCLSVKTHEIRHRGASPGFFLRFAVLTLMLFYAAIIQGCAYGIYDDKRLLDTMADDKALAASIKTGLLKAHFGDAFSVAVYSFYGNVFLVGEVPQNVQARALEIARSFKPRSVTPHWFPVSRGQRNNLALATELRAALIGTRGLSSTRIDTEVNGDRVVLLGVVQDESEKQLAIRTARQVKGVVSVTSYLLLPPKTGK